MSFKRLTKTVAAAATAEALSATSIRCSWFTVQPIMGDNGATGKNTGRVWIGDSTVTNTGLTGYMLEIPTADRREALTVAPGNGADVFDLSKIFVAVGVNGEGVVVLYSAL